MVSNAVDTKLKVILGFVWPIANSIIMVQRLWGHLDTSQSLRNVF